MSAPLVLGIETSCDETAIGIVKGRTLLANEIASSVQEHARFGGVVPEIASRAHLEAMIPALDRALKTAKVSLKDIDAIAAGTAICTLEKIGSRGSWNLSDEYGNDQFAISVAPTA